MSNWKSPGYTGDTKDPGNPHCYEAFIHRDAPCESCHALESFATGKPVQAEYFNPSTKRYSEIKAYPVFDDSNKVIMVAEHVRDITKRKQMEDTLRESQAFYHSLVEQLPAGVFRKDHEGRYVFVSPWFCRLKGVKEEEFLGKTPQEVAGSDAAKSDATEQAIKYAAEGADQHVRIMQNGNPIELVEEYTDAAGRKQFVHAIKIPVFNSEGKVIGTQGILFDITERKLAEEALRENEKKYRLLADNVDDVIFVLDMNLNYTYVSPSVKTLRGYEPEEVLKQQVSIGTLTPSSLDLAMTTLSEVMTLDKSERREIPISRTLQLEMMRKDGTTVWTEVRFSFIRDEDQRPVGILGVTRDITERKQAVERIRKALRATVQAITVTVETRDPYTAGHQRKVSDLARAIATEMNLPADMIDGIRMAAAIHDLGKISVPAEILSKPTKLSGIEFSLIKTHSQSGYDILKDIDFPWPIARIVLEHHERMNGSGYPNGLKGDNILMEARILTVADVVEAMASHRPYRPGLGIDLALAEIEKNRGIFYDNAVADACLRLFREKGFKLEGLEYK